MPCGIVDKVIREQPFCSDENASPRIIPGTFSHTDGTRSLPPPYSASEGDPYPHIHVKHNEVPPKFKAGFFDIVLNFAEDDEAIAHQLIRIFEKCIRFGQNQKPRICTTEDFPWIGDKIVAAFEAINRSTYMFILLTDKYVKEEWSSMVQNEMLMETLTNPDKRWCAVPLFLKRKRDLGFRIPFGLSSLKGIELPKIFSPQVQSLDEVDLDAIGPDDLDPYFKQNMAMMLNDKAHLRQEKEEVSRKEKDKWLFEEKRKRWKKMEEERVKKEKEEEHNRKQLAADQSWREQKENEPYQPRSNGIDVKVNGELGSNNTLASYQPVHLHLHKGYEGPLPNITSNVQIKKVEQGAFGENAQVHVHNGPAQVSSQSLR